MAWIASTESDQTASSTLGELWYLRPTRYLPVLDADRQKIALPSGVNTIRANPQSDFLCTEGFSRMYFTNGWDDNLVVTENMKALRMGIQAPSNPIISGAGAGKSVGVALVSGPGRTGTAVFYFRWVDTLHFRFSPLSGASPSFTMADNKAQITNLPTTCPDESVDALEILCSMDGESPRVVVRRDLGCTTITEGVPTGSLGSAVTEIVGKFPRCRMNKIWHNRMVMAGDDRFPDRLYLSPINDYENYSGLWLRTKNGQPIVAIAIIRDTLVLYGPTSSFTVTGYTEDDFDVQFHEPKIGSIGHPTITMIHDLALVHSHQGPYLDTGQSMHFVGNGLESMWKAEFQAHEDFYCQDAWAVTDLESRVAKLWVGEIDRIQRLIGDGNDVFIGFTGGPNNYWLFDYSSVSEEEGGSFAAPELMFDARKRRDYSGAMLALPRSRRAWLFTGSDEGMIRLENYAADDTDDGDGLLEETPEGEYPPVGGLRTLLETKHIYPYGPGGAPDDGAKITDFWAMGSLRDSRLTIFCGEQNAAVPDRDEAQSPDWTVPIPAFDFTIIDALKDAEGNVDPPSGNFFLDEENFYVQPNVSGRGFTTWFRDFKNLTGFGFSAQPGEQARGLRPPGIGGG